MSERFPQPWEVWHAQLDFSEGHGRKNRPVVVLATRPGRSLVAMVTNTTNKLLIDHDWKPQVALVVSSLAACAKALDGGLEAALHAGDGFPRDRPEAPP